MAIDSHGDLMKRITAAAVDIMVPTADTAAAAAVPAPARDAPVPVPVRAAGGPDVAKRIFTAMKLKYSKKIRQISWLWFCPKQHPVLSARFLFSMKNS